MYKKVLAYKKHTVINDPIYGFISIPRENIFQVINHPYFQRLRRISQLGLTQYVYPGARHSRFEHALGATHLMGLSLNSLRSKGIEITEEEYNATQLAILLHDVGHGPFSHTLEHSLVEGVHHEHISTIIMNELNKEFDGALDCTIKIFEDKHPKKFLHQLVSSQLDMDRMDYLNRDSFYTGVSEGIVNYDRIINKLNVHNNELVVEYKGLYSVEKFITARRLMYWQVYLHKTTLGVDQIIIKILKRAKELALAGENLQATPFLSYFLSQKIELEFFENNKEALEHFTKLDDHDIVAAIKSWTVHKDKVLSMLCNFLINRKLFKVELSEHQKTEEELVEIRKTSMQKLNVSNSEIDYFVTHGKVSNHAYNDKDDTIKVIFANKELKEVSLSSDLLTISAMAKKVDKYFVCYPK